MYHHIYDGHIGITMTKGLLTPKESAYIESLTYGEVPGDTGQRFHERTMKRINHESVPITKQTLEDMLTIGKYSAIRDNNILNKNRASLSDNLELISEFIKTWISKEEMPFLIESILIDTRKGYLDQEYPNQTDILVVFLKYLTLIHFIVKDDDNLPSQQMNMEIDNLKNSIANQLMDFIRILSKFDCVQQPYSPFWRLMELGSLIPDEDPYGDREQILSTLSDSIQHRNITIQLVELRKENKKGIPGWMHNEGRLIKKIMEDTVFFNYKGSKYEVEIDFRLNLPAVILTKLFDPQIDPVDNSKTAKPKEYRLFEILISLYSDIIQRSVFILERETDRLDNNGVKEIIKGNIVTPYFSKESFRNALERESELPFEINYSLIPTISRELRIDAIEVNQVDLAEYGVCLNPIVWKEIQKRYHDKILALARPMKALDETNKAFLEKSRGGLKELAYESLNELKQSGFVEKVDSSDMMEYKEESFRLSKKGEEYLKTNLPFILNKGILPDVHIKKIPD